MKTILLTWNPAKFAWANLSKTARKVRAGQLVTGSWSCGVRQNIDTRDRLFLIRQGTQGHRGIVGSGHATSEPYWGKHHDPDLAAEGKQKLYVDLEWDALIDPEVDPVLPRSVLDEPPLDQVHWSSQSSGILISEAIAPVLERLWAQHLNLPPPGTIPPDEDDDEDWAIEGERKNQFRLHRQRESRLRKAKIAAVLQEKGHLRCEVPRCGFEFAAVYGPIGEDFAHVHHLKPLAHREAPERTVLSDLAIVCPNCHAMIHRGGECRPLQGLIQAGRPI